MIKELIKDRGFFIMAKKEKLLTPGNVILGIIIIALIGSLFFDFFGGIEDDPLGCPRPIDNFIVTNIVYANNGNPIFEDRVIKEDDNPLNVYTVSALLRNIGKENIIIAQLGLTLFNLGPLELVKINGTVIESQSLKAVTFQVPSGTYHKIDFYSDNPCEGVTVWHEYGAGSSFAWELETETNSTTNETDEMSQDESVS